LDQVLELPPIARPGVRGQRRHGFFRNVFNGLNDLAAIQPDKMRDQCGNVFANSQMKRESIGHWYIQGHRKERVGSTFVYAVSSIPGFVSFLPKDTLPVAQRRVPAGAATGQGTR
jgi:hypothetical protein